MRGGAAPLPLPSPTGRAARRPKLGGEAPPSSSLSGAAVPAALTPRGKSSSGPSPAPRGLRRRRCAGGDPADPARGGEGSRCRPPAPLRPGRAAWGDDADISGGKRRRIPGDGGGAAQPQAPSPVGGGEYCHGCRCRGEGRHPSQPAKTSVPRAVASAPPSSFRRRPCHPPPPARRFRRPSSSSSKTSSPLPAPWLTSGVPIILVPGNKRGLCSPEGWIGSVFWDAFRNCARQDTDGRGGGHC